MIARPANRWHGSVKVTSGGTAFLHGGRRQADKKGDPIYFRHGCLVFLVWPVRDGDPRDASTQIGNNEYWIVATQQPYLYN
ncbi:hypothetical protein FAZ95_37585 [Trinickia violacea]|uniref:Uncharacterized protein n=1 Tax=Trinickia violacea TaxID=2571746 RepID=A0A4V1EIQ5_9BURK|nr:hypothetical protein [Trinickia violacea]QCP54590.1 hypothetical protein FAZ95_37585 [Trinickia violacea]